MKRMLKLKNLPKRRKRRRGDSMIDLKHLKDVKLNYFKHLRFIWFESIRGMLVMIGLIIHGIFPFVLTNMFSSYIKNAEIRIKEIGI